MPAVILLLLWWKEEKVSWRQVWPLLPFFVVGIASGAFTAWMEQKHVGAVGEEWLLSGMQRCLIAGRALWFYAGKLFWPGNLTFIYPRWDIDTGVWWQYLYPLASLSLMLLLWLLRGRMGRGPLVAVLCFSGTLVPALGFFNVFPFRYSFVADHFQYLASISLIALGTESSILLFQALGKHGRWLGGAIGFAIVILLGTQSWHHGRAFANSENLWRDTLSKNPTAWIAHNNLGNILSARGQHADAISHFMDALRLAPNDPDAHNNLGVVFASQGNFEDASRHYLAASRLDPRDPTAHNNIGNILAVQGKFDEAIAHFTQALKLNPNFAETHNNLAYVLATQGNYAEAITQYSEAVRLNPKYTAAQNNLRIVEATRDRMTATHFDQGNALVAQRNFADAIGQYMEALRLNPKFAEAHNNLGIALRELNRIAEAELHFREALQLNPDFVEARANLDRIRIP